MTEQFRDIPSRAGHWIISEWPKSPKLTLIGLLLFGYTGKRSSACRRIVITGAHGAGKTALLLALHARGYTIVGDTARRIIQERHTRGLSPRPGSYESRRKSCEETLRTSFITA